MIPKFRAWNKPTRKMYYQNNFNCFYIGGRGEWVLRDIRHNLHSEPLAGYRVSILMQSTGLHDKDGKEIFEGDILKYIDPWGRKEVDHIEGIVEFGYHNYSTHVMGANDEHQILGWVIKKRHSNSPLVECKTIEIIGNIYENSELLEEARG